MHVRAGTTNWGLFSLESVPARPVPGSWDLENVFRDPGGGAIDQALCLQSSLPLHVPPFLAGPHACCPFKVSGC